jgi:DNA-binding Lrp family transcriptional regulator
MKEIELKLISELMKNSRRSDRELAKAIGASQPTVSRIIKTLEKEGYIREYTMIPDFNKLGLGLMAVTFVKWPKKFIEEEYDGIIKTASDLDRKKGMSIIMVVRGMGSDYDMIIVSVHESYSACRELIADIRRLPSASMLETQSFLVDLTKDTRYRPLTFSSLAEFLRKNHETEKEHAKP